jgi:hypothetical protein
MEMVEVYHPILDRTVEVPVQSFEHLSRSGWIRSSDRVIEAVAEEYPQEEMESGDKEGEE